MHLREPVLWRGPGELQLGTTANARILAGLTPGEMDLLLDLTRPRSAEWVAAAVDANGVDPGRWAELRSALDPPRGARDGAQARGQSNGTVLLLDSHPLSSIAGAQLAARGVSVVTAARGMQGRDAARPPRAPALAILTDAWVTDPIRVAPLMRHDVPHLPLVVDAGVSIGPVVVPGETACTWCLELARTDADPRWPAVATQLRVLEDDGLAEPDLAGALVAWVVTAFLLDGNTQGWRLDDSLLPVDVAPHPRCRHCVTPPSADARDHA